MHTYGYTHANTCAQPHPRTRVPQNTHTHRIHTCIHVPDMQGTHTDIAHKYTQTQACTNSVHMHTPMCTCSTHTCAYAVTCMCKPRNTYKIYSHVNMHTMLRIHMCIHYTLSCAHVQSHIDAQSHTPHTYTHDAGTRDVHINTHVPRLTVVPSGKRENCFFF